jgi:hypothetical protein
MSASAYESVCIYIHLSVYVGRVVRVGIYACIVWMSVYTSWGLHVCTNVCFEVCVCVCVSANVCVCVCVSVSVWVCSVLCRVSASK